MSETSRSERRARRCAGFLVALSGLVLCAPAVAQQRADASHSPAATVVDKKSEEVGDDEEARSKTRRYALIVTHNESVDEGVEALRYADDDGARYYELFSAMTSEARLLTVLDADSQKLFPGMAARTKPPTRARLRVEVARLSEKIAADRSAGRRAEVYLVFAGHGDVDDNGEGYLSLADGRLRRSELFREVIRPLGADYTHLIIDACHAYYMVNSRGGADDEEWEDDRSGRTLDAEFESFLEKDGDARTKGSVPTTIGVVLSTSGTAEVHEWNRYRAGVFSHELRSGLLGAADVDGDGAVTYAEIDAYLAAANAGVSNPKARISVHARAPRQNRSQPLLGLDDFRGVTTLRVPVEGGRFYLEDDRGLRYADLHLSKDTDARVMLLRRASGSRSHYFLRSGDREARIALDSKEASVAGDELAFREASDGARGAVDEAYRTELFATPYGPAFFAGYRAGRERLERDDVRRPGVRLREEGARAWDMRPTVGYAAGPSLFGHAGGVQHSLGLALPFFGGSGWAIGPFLGYGVSMHVGERWGYESGGSTHRLAFGAELSYEARLGERVSLVPSLRLGHQLVFVDADVLRADPVGVRAAARLALSWRGGERWRGLIFGGVSADLVTDASIESNRERWYLGPMAGVGVRF
jgi:hypothetical protein